MKIRILLLVLLCAGCSAPPKSEINIYAAASLTEALQEIGTEFERVSQIHPVFNFASSGILARQIMEGSPADIFFSADEQRMDWLQNKSLIDVPSRINKLSNSLVIVAPKESATVMKSAADLLARDGNIAVADPEIVPAGMYAKAYLMQEGLWDQLEPRMIRLENVRAALAAVESGNAVAGIVYKTDALISSNLTIAYEVLPGKGPKIVYPVAVLREAKNRQAAYRFVEFLNSSNATRIFEKHGFIVASNAAAPASRA